MYRCEYNGANWGIIGITFAFMPTRRVSADLRAIPGATYERVKNNLRERTGIKRIGATYGGARFKLGRSGSNFATGQRRSFAAGG